MNLLQPDDVRPLPNVVWNLFLALIPVLLAFLIARRVRLNAAGGRRPVSPLVVLLLVVWAVFLPNTCYLLTEWRHYIVNIADGSFYPQVRYDHVAVVRLLISTAFYVFYSGSGLIAFFLAVWPLDRLVREHAPRRALLLKLIIFALCGLGVYLGLIHRFNTWDLVNPARLPAILHIIAEIMMRRFVLVLTVGFTAVLWLLYEAFDIWMDGFIMRSRRDDIDEPARVSTIV
jgi:uncharacterized membrane protein